MARADYIPAGQPAPAHSLIPSGRDFIPEEEMAKLRNQTPTVCPVCDADFSDHPNPVSALRGHMGAKHAVPKPKKKKARKSRAKAQPEEVAVVEPEVADAPAAPEVAPEEVAQTE
jgi:hypothetical protein